MTRLVVVAYINSLKCYFQPTPEVQETAKWLYGARAPAAPDCSADKRGRLWPWT